MLVVAISAKGSEYLYKASSAHRVSKASAQKICDVLNKHNYRLKENQVWHVHEVGCYDNAYIYSEDQKFTVYRGAVKDTYYARYW